MKFLPSILSFSPPAGDAATTSKGPQIRGAILAGTAVVGLFFGAGGLWAATADLASAAVASGRLTMDGNRRTVQHLEGGIIRVLHVRDGSKVAAGDILVTLDDLQARATWDLLNGQFLALRALEARLIAERDGMRRITFPPDLRDATETPEIAQVMRGQEVLLTTRMRSQDTRRNILRQRIAQLHTEIDSLSRQISATDEQIAVVVDEEATVRRLVNQGLERRPRVQALEREHARLRGQRDQEQGSMARARQQIGEAEFEILSLQSTFQTEVATELRETQTRIADLRERMAAAADVLARMVVTAPIDGVVVDLQFFTPGGVVPPGKSILDIVPDDDTLIVEARVKPNDVDAVTKGLGAKVHFTGLKARTTPTLEGEVIYVSADSSAEERTGEHFYTARVSIPAEQLALLGGQHMTPGMPADVVIVTGSRTALQYILQPLTDSFRYAFRES